MRPNKLRELLKANKPTLSTHIHSTWPSVVEAIGHTSLYDYVEFAGEYGPYDLHDLDNLARAGDLYNMSMMLKVDQELASAPGRPASEYGRLCQGAGGPEGGDRCRRVLMLPTLYALLGAEMDRWIAAQKNRRP